MYNEIEKAGEVHERNRAVIYAPARRKTMSQRAFIVYRHPLFGEAIHLLLTRGGIQVLGMASDKDRARQEIENLQPDVVLLELSDEEEPLAISWLSPTRSPTRAKQITIGVSFLDNRFLIWHQENRVLTRAEDLIEAIRSTQENIT